MTPTSPEVSASQISELLLYHAVLGRGYTSPFPATKGLTFSSALPDKAIYTLAAAETSFRQWHEKSIEGERQALELMELQPESMGAVTGRDNKLEGKKLKERLSRRPHITWKEDQVTKSTLVELMKTHYYGAMTYVDPVGARLAASLCHQMRLASDLGWVTLTEGTTDETLIRATSSGGACIHSLAGTETIFNHFCACKLPHLEKLEKRIKETSGGQVGIGTTVVIKGYPGEFSGVTTDTLYSLATRVFALGEKDPEKRARVIFAPGTEAAWRQFLDWTLADLVGETPSAWQLKLSVTAPTSPRTSVMFAARAALVMAFIQIAELKPDGPLKLVELDLTHLEVAKSAARLLYRMSSGEEGHEKRMKNLKPAKDNFITPAKLAIARVALTEAINATPDRRLARTQVRRGAAVGATLGLLDELVRLGDIVELTGTEECKRGRATKAYVLPQDAPGCDELEAFDEYQEATEDFVSNPDAFSDGEALVTVRRIREKAEAFNTEHVLPAVPLSRLSKQERRMLPKILSMFPRAFLLRGAATDVPEPPRLMADDDVELDREGANLWVRHKANGAEFCDWRVAGLLQLGDVWGS